MHCESSPLSNVTIVDDHFLMVFPMKPIRSIIFLLVFGVWRLWIFLNTWDVDLIILFCLDQKKKKEKKKDYTILFVDLFLNFVCG
jgi:hypothetical protein